MGRGNPSDGGQVSQGDREVLRGVLEGDRKQGLAGAGAQEPPHPSLVKVCGRERDCTIRNYWDGEWVVEKECPTA